MELLFEANREAAIANDKARGSADAHAAPHTLPPHSSLCLPAPPRPPATAMPHHTMWCAVCYVSQEGKLPLHHAAAKGAPLDVMRLLLDTNPEAASALAQARRRADDDPSRHRRRCCSVARAPSFRPVPLLFSAYGTRYVTRLHALLRRTESCHSTTLPPRVRRSR